jgi:hypothetical protein
MKQKIFWLLAAAFVCLFTFSAFTHHPFGYQLIACRPTTDGTSGELLEQLTATLQKAKGKSVTSTYLINGSKSPLRFKLNETCLEVLCTTGQPDPFQNITLYKLTTSKTNRTLTITTDGSNNTSWIPMQIPYEESNKWKVIPAAILTVGEYAFVDKTTMTTNGNVVVWTFGIDQ